MKELQRICKALGNPRRMAIMQMLLRRRELSVGTIAGMLKISLAATSKHLTMLTNLDLLEKRQESLVVFYSIPERASPLVRQVLQLLRSTLP